MRTGIMALLAFYAFSCSTLTVENQEIIPVENLTPENVETDLDVIEFIVDPHDFDSIYSNHQSDIIISTKVNWYGPDRELLIDSAAAQMEIKGSGSTNYALKSLGFTFEQDIDNSAGIVFGPDKVLEEHSLQRLRSMRVRSSGSDFFGTMFKDRAYTEMAIEAELDFEFMYSEPVLVFVNGSFYGLMNVRSESNAAAISRLFESETEAVTLLDVDTDNENLEYREGDEQLAQQVIDALNNGETDQLSDLIDVSSFIDYIIYEDYIGNSDWPGNNGKAYSLDGAPFRFFLFDLDRAADRPHLHPMPAMEYLDADIALIYQSLIKRPGFCDMLKSRQKEVYDKLSPDLFNRIVARFAARIEDDIRYQIGKYSTPESMLHWRLNIEEIKRDFKVQDRHAREKYGL